MERLRAAGSVEPDPPRRLDLRTLEDGVRRVGAADPDLAVVVRRHGRPPLWARRPGLPTLVQIILEQQVSLSSGRAAYHRVEMRLGKVTADSILACGPDELRAVGVTRQKAAYCVDLAERVDSGTLDLARIARSGDGAARAELQTVKGIGPWTADVYLLMALRRPDVWPMGDIALLTALQRLRRLPRRPTVAEAEEIALRWSPWRAVAARILWHGYLEGSLAGADRS